MKVFSQTELAKEVAHRAGCSVDEAKAMIGVIFDSIKFAMYSGSGVNIPKFGKLFVHRTSPKLMITPTGEKLWIGERLRPKVKFSGYLVDQLAKTKGTDNGETTEE